jgi:serine/threonine protein kinase/Tol biopolymer transport system component
VTASLQPGAVVGRFRIVSLLGAGGMGQVYLARDESLDRSVALKILPPELVKNDERVRRFIQEAKSASSLSHPNIVTIHEIGETAVDATRVHFIAMELVQGSTLKDLIHTKKTDLRTLLRYLAQAAEGIGKAHAAGIVHRDLKPENLMVTDDGFAKVLDFGLAKLTETGVGNTTETRTALGAPTGAGMILGTVGYMSPEQVQAKPLDHRSDIFSFGCILYEAATRQRPFVADSDIETLHQIVKEKPTAVEELNAQVPADVRRLIRRCLAKAPEQRLQSMKDLALELAEIAEQYDTLSSGPSGASGGSAVSGIETKLPGIGRFSATARGAIGAGAIVGLAALAFMGWQQFVRRTERAPTSLASLQIASLARITGMTQAILSADGRLLAYTLEQSRFRQFSIVARQMATNQDVIIVPEESNPGLAGISPDGSYVYFSRGAIDRRRHLYRVPSVGGVPRQVFEDVDQLSFSPDGKQIVVVAGSGLRIANADGTEPRTLVTIKQGSVSAPAWSPDGKHIVAAVYRPATPPTHLVAFNAADGREQAVGTTRWSNMWALAWLPDGTGLVATGTGAGDGTQKLWFVTWPDGATRRITNDTKTYRGSVSVSADSKTLATLLVGFETSLWVAPGDQPENVTRVAGETPVSVTALPDGRVLHRTEPTPDKQQLWAMAADGTGRQRLTPDHLVPESRLLIAAQADVIVFTTSRPNPIRRVWRMDSNGGGLAEVLIDKDAVLYEISPDGRSLYVGKRDAANSTILPEIWRVSIAGGAEELVGDTRKASPPKFSPNGRLIHRLLTKPERRTDQQIEIVDAAGGNVIRTLTLPASDTLLAWAPSSDALLVMRMVDRSNNAWRVPIDGRPATQATRFGPNEFSGGTYTADGSRLFLLRRERTPGEMLLFTNFR